MIQCLTRASRLPNCSACTTALQCWWAAIPPSVCLPASFLVTPILTHFASLDLIRCSAGGRRLHGGPVCGAGGISRHPGGDARWALLPLKPPHACAADLRCSTRTISACGVGMGGVCSVALAARGAPLSSLPAGAPDIDKPACHRHQVLTVTLPLTNLSCRPPGAPPARGGGHVPQGLRVPRL